MKRLSGFSTKIVDLNMVDESDLRMISEEDKHFGADHMGRMTRDSQWRSLKMVLLLAEAKNP